MSTDRRYRVAEYEPITEHRAAELVAEFFGIDYKAFLGEKGMMLQESRGGGRMSNGPSHRRTVGAKEVKIISQGLGICPFCRSQPSVIYDDEIEEWFVGCSASECPACPHIGPYVSPEAAVDAWNSVRSPVPSQVFIITIDNGRHRYFQEVLRDPVKAEILADGIRKEFLQSGSASSVDVVRCMVFDDPVTGVWRRDVIGRAMRGGES